MILDIEDVVKKYEKEIIMASYLYYHATSDNVQSPLTDVEYDARVNFVLRNWSKTSKKFRERITKEELSSSGFSLKATDKEKKEALKWMKIYNK